MASIQKLKNGIIRVKVSYYTAEKRQKFISKNYRPPIGYTDKQIQAELNIIQFELEQEVAKRKDEEKEHIATKTNKNVLLSETADLYINSILDAKIKTISDYKIIIKNHIKPYFINIKTKDIDRIMVQSFINYLYKNKKLKSTSVGTIYAVLRNIINFALDYNIINTSPCTNIKLPKNKHKEVEIYTTDDIKHLFKALETEPLQYQVIYALLFETGCRVSEILALQWNDIDFETGVITISKSITKAPNKEPEITDTKTSTDRKVTISTSGMAITLLQRYYKEQPHIFNISSRGKHKQQLFKTKEGSLMYHSMVFQFQKGIEKKYGLPHRRVHAIRHTNASLLLAEGMDLKTVSSRLGHANINTTNKYLHAIPEKEKQAGEVISKIMNELTGTND